MKLELLAQYLEDQSVGHVGQDIFVHHMDFSQTYGTLLRLPLDGIKRDWDLPGYYARVPIQAIVRHTTQQDGDFLIKAVSQALTIYKKSFPSADDEQLVIQQMLPNNLPIVYPRGAGDSIEWSVTFHATYWQPG